MTFGIEFCFLLLSMGKKMIKKSNESEGLKKRYSQIENFFLSQIEKDRDHNVK